MNGSSPTPPARPHQRFTEDGRRVREILTYSRRGSRLSEKQQAAWDAHHAAFVIPEDAVDRPGFSWVARFEREAPLVVEIGSGRGETIAAAAVAHPERNHLACEVYVPGVARTVARLAHEDAEHVRIVQADAVQLLGHALPEASVDELWVFYPDPWHKSRHHKRRLVSPSFARLVSRVLRDGGVWRIATDWADYAEQIAQVLDGASDLEGGVVERFAGRPETRFARKAREEGRPTTDFAVTRVARQRG